MASNDSDYANAAAFVRRIKALDNQMGWENRVAAGFALGETLKTTAMIHHASGSAHYDLPMVVKHCAECK